ncbi:hypothetical protein CQW31_17785 [Pseudomonas sp. 382]|nr:hypothetical protein CQW31_17785 [Pseudomonas sp. 382]
MRTLTLLIYLTSAALYLAASVLVLRIIAPAMVSSESDALVALGFILIAVWLIASITIAHYLITKRRAPAATTQEENP